MSDPQQASAADPRFDHQAHLEAGGCSRCKSVSVFFAVVSLIAAVVLLVGVFTGTIGDAAFYGAALALVIPALLSIRVRGWHYTRLYLNRVRDEDVETSTL